ncbi:non-canonical purine NTP pyrophosphatase, partial [bacterium]
MKPLVVATHNPKKAGEMVRILSAALPDREILTLVDYPNAPEPEETGADYEANALLKARSGVAATGEPCIADDAG